MKTERMTQAEFDDIVLGLKRAVGALRTIVGEQFPDGFIYDPEFDTEMATGSEMLNTRMEMIGKTIGDVVEWYDHLQVKLGIPPRHGRRFDRYINPPPPIPKKPRS
jgi:hypothetical protein